MRERDLEKKLEARIGRAKLGEQGRAISEVGVKYSTGCKSRIRKMFEFKNWKEPMLVLKQTIYQQKALDLIFNMAP